MSEMTIDEVMRILPHRYPFLLIDRIEAFVEGSGSNRVGNKVRTRKNVTFNENFFPGHFPHRPVLPAVMQIEIMAQAAAISAHDPENPDINMGIAAVNSAKFRRPVLPGDTLIVEAEIIKDRGRVIVAQCQAFVDNDLVAEAEIMASVI